MTQDPKEQQNEEADGKRLVEEPRMMQAPKKQAEKEQRLQEIKAADVARRIQVLKDKILARRLAREDEDARRAERREAKKAELAEQSVQEGDQVAETEAEEQQRWRTKFQDFAFGDPFDPRSSFM